VRQSEKRRASMMLDFPLPRYNEPPVETDQVNDLWSWGGVPRGWKLVNGVLVRDTNSTQTQIGSDWLGSTTDSLYTMAYNESSWIPPF